MPKKLFSFFSGSGFLDLGFETNDFEVVYVNEYHQPFLDAYKHSRQKMQIDEPIYGFDNTSIEDIASDKVLLDRLIANVAEQKRLGHLTGFIGGPPCPDFSIGGKNKGKEGENGKLTQTYCEVVCNSKPDFFLFENVKGLWRTARHKEFYDEIRARYKKAGYLLSDRLTNSLEFGAPQDRDRVILLGFHKSAILDNNIKTEKTLKSALRWNQYLKFDLDEIFKYPWPDRTHYVENLHTEAPKEIPVELTVEYWFRKNDVVNHSNASHHFVPRAALPRFQTIDEGDDGKKSFKRLHRWRYSPTAAYGNNEVHIHPYLPRRISAAEALAIQSLPKRFELPVDMSLSNMFKTIGNGVPYLMASGIALITRDFLNEYCTE
ncbi:DNA cytosine methyltransferase [Alteromonas lipotrueae]|uniref:DNA cytosine methyltransferase n=1 Tax=Alteromonas lipotrueae TaxID=2803814 RepID=UPI001C48D1D8|nr:DNA cytosine methyltransferase [Alteromonas lipotrueae]